MEENHTKEQRLSIFALVIAAFVMIFILGSCSPSLNKCISEHPTHFGTGDTIIQIQEKIVKETVYKDTTIVVQTIQADTVRTTDTVYMDRYGIINMPRKNLETQYARAWVQIVNGRVDFELQQKEAEIQLTIENAIREYKESHQITETVYVPKPFPIPISWWDQLWMGLGKIFAMLIGALLALLAVKLIKPF